MVASLFRRPGRALFAASVAFATPAAALTIPGVAAVTLDASADVVSDYRFRGVSLSDRQPVVEGSVDAGLGAWFAGVEVISASRVRSPYRPTRADAEVDVSAGWSHSFGLLTPAAGVIAYLHPGGGEAVNGEVFASLAGALGPATLTAGANYAPPEAAAHGGNLYLFTRAAAGIPGTPLTLHTSVGRERGAFAGDAVKTDWSAGVEVRVLRVVALGVDYVGNDRPTVGPGRVERNRENGFVVRAGVRF